MIPVNYQYPVSAAIYKIIDKADAEYAEFLHEKGYGKGYKLFTFSDIRCPFKIESDRLKLLQQQAEIIICFHLPKAAETFIKGLFLSQQIDIADKRSKGTFHISSVETLPDPLQGKENNKMVEMTLEPISPIVCGEKNERDNYDFLQPGDEHYCEMLMINWKEKIRSIYGEDEYEEIMEGSYIRPEFYRNPPKSRLITIKDGTPAETKIRGFVNFKVAVAGKKEAVEVLLNAGVGLYNAMGCGCVRGDSC